MGRAHDCQARGRRFEFRKLFAPCCHLWALWVPEEECRGRTKGREGRLQKRTSTVPLFSFPLVNVFVRSAKLWLQTGRSVHLVPFIPNQRPSEPPHPQWHKQRPSPNSSSAVFQGWKGVFCKNENVVYRRPSPKPPPEGSSWFARQATTARIPTPPPTTPAVFQTTSSSPLALPPPPMSFGNPYTNPLSHFACWVSDSTLLRPLSPPRLFFFKLRRAVGEVLSLLVNRNSLSGSKLVVRGRSLVHPQNRACALLRV
jgi:hypothetical protein